MKRITYVPELEGFWLVKLPYIELLLVTGNSQMWSIKVGFRYYFAGFPPVFNTLH